MRRKMPYPAKIMATGVVFKAVIMATLVTVIAATTFIQSIILVLVSATATGIFGLVIVLIQVHSERGLHERINKMETQIDTKSDEIKTQASDIAEKTQQIAEVVTPNEETT